jgi:hypothetical protein
MICAGNLAFSSGCHLFDRKPRPPIFAPVLQPGASLSQVIEAVHNNSRQIHSFSTNEAELSGPGIPVTLRGASIVFERPRRLRIQAGTGITGSELDVGSNDELFWFWVRRSEPPAVLFCRHDQYASCEAARRIPFEPAWLIEAFGIVEFSPNDRHQGPITRPDGRLELVTIRQTACGPATKKTVVDASTGLIHEQHLYDYQGRVVASVVVREHRLDPLTNLVMPKVVDLQCPQAQLSMQVNLGKTSINQPLGNGAMWTMPMVPGWPLVNLADPNWWRVLGGQSTADHSGTSPTLPYGPPDGRHSFNRLR